MTARRPALREGSYVTDLHSVEGGNARTLLNSPTKCLIAWVIFNFMKWLVAWVICSVYTETFGLEIHLRRVWWNVWSSKVICDIWYAKDVILFQSSAICQNQRFDFRCESSSCTNKNLKFWFQNRNPDCWLGNKNLVFWFWIQDLEFWQEWRDWGRVKLENRIP